jgi:predicted RNA-binding protein YlxR (DUF448 family)
MAASPQRDQGGDGETHRKCLVTGETRATGDLLRFVVDPEGQIVPDVAGKLPGRGYWVTARRDLVDRAVKTKGFERAVARARKGAAGATVKVNPDLAQWVEDLLTRRCLDYLGLARRAGQLVTGFEKVRAFLGARSDAILVEARDASVDGSRKLLSGLSPTRIVHRFTREQLSLALGRQNVVHAAVEADGVGTRFLECADRLEHYAPAAAAIKGESPQDLGDKARQYE